MGHRALTDLGFASLRASRTNDAQIVGHYVLPSNLQKRKALFVFVVTGKKPKPQCHVLQGSRTLVSPFRRVAPLPAAVPVPTIPW